MRTFITIALALTSILSLAQTDIIEIRSRSASLETYVKTSKTNKIDHAYSNFGLDPSMERRMVTPDMLPPLVYLDSVKNIKEKGVVFFTRQQCPKSVLADDAMSQLPCPTRADTLREIVLQSNFSLDSFKKAIHINYVLTFEMDSTKFIDFIDSSEIRSEEIFLKQKRKKENAIGWELLFMLITPILFAFGVNRWVIPKLLITK